MNLTGLAPSPRLEDAAGTPRLEARGLPRRYGEQLALDALDLRVNRGAIYCLLGPNGAGETTAILLFLGFLEPTSGSALVAGLDVTAHPLETKRHLAYIPEEVMLYGNLTGLENLEYFASPALLAHSALLETAGTGDGRFTRFEEQVRAFVDEFRTFFVPAILAGERTSADVVRRLPCFTDDQDDPVAVRARVLPPLVALLLLMALVAAPALRGLGRVQGAG